MGNVISIEELRKSQERALHFDLMMIDNIISMLQDARKKIVSKRIDDNTFEMLDSILDRTIDFVTYVNQGGGR